LAHQLGLSGHFPLKRVQEQMTCAKFEHLSQFLRRPDWEATNNSAERVGRAFRQRQTRHHSIHHKIATIFENSVTAK
jgi:hypothetical protein